MIANALHPGPAVLLACKIAQHYEGLILKPYLDPAGPDYRIRQHVLRK